MKRSIIFILICLVFGASMSVAVAWLATLGPWVEEDKFTIEENGWKAAMWSTDMRTSIHAINESSTEKILNYRASPTGLDKFEKHQSPSWFSLSDKPSHDGAEIRGCATGWPLKCLYFVQDIGSGPYYTEWDFVTYGGIVGTNPFLREEQYAWNVNHIPLRVIPLGLLANAFVFCTVIVFPVLIFRLNLRQRAKYHQRRKRCPYCKYDVSHATSTICSECGVDTQTLPQWISKKTLLINGAVTLVLITCLISYGFAFTIQPPYNKLHHAAFKGDLEEVRRQIESGVDLDSTSEINEHPFFALAFTPLSLAVSREHTDIIRLLLESGADLESPNSLGTTALHTAVEEGSVECLALLIEAGANVNAAQSEYVDALFFIANRSQLNIEIFNIILEAGYHLEPNGKKVDTAIHTAIRAGNSTFIHRLLELGAIPGYGSVRVATAYGRVDLLKLFVKQGAVVTNLSKNDWPLLHSINVEHNPRETFLFLFDQGVEIDLRDFEGATALMRAAQQIEPELVQIFLEHGANPNLRNDIGMSALDLLLDWAGISLIIRDPEGNVLKIVQMLLDAGVEVLLIDNKGEPRLLDLYPELERLLKEHAASNTKEKQQDD